MSQNYKFFKVLHELIGSIWKEFWAKIPVWLAYSPCFSFSGSVEHFQIKWGLAYMVDIICPHDWKKVTMYTQFFKKTVWFFSVLRLVSKTFKRNPNFFPFFLKSTENSTYSVPSEWATTKCDIVCTYTYFTTNFTQIFFIYFQCL